MGARWHLVAGTVVMTQASTECKCTERARLGAIPQPLPIPTQPTVCIQLGQQAASRRASGPLNHAGRCSGHKRWVLG